MKRWVLVCISSFNELVLSMKCMVWNLHIIPRYLQHNGNDVSGARPAVIL